MEADATLPGLVWSRFDLRPDRRATAPAPVPPDYGDKVLDAIAPAIDPVFYRNEAGLAPEDDPVRHYAQTGAKAGLAPNTWFDTRWYLDSYRDVAASGMNPLYHYVVFGKAEGRKPRRPGGMARRIVEQASIPAHRRPGYDAPADAARLDAVSLAHLLASACAGRDGFVLSISHDCYVNVTGGMQLLIADEQARFRAQGATYLHLAPAIARLTFAPDLPDSPYAGLLQVVLDGQFLGLTTVAAMSDALGALGGRLPARRRMVVHSVFGHRVDDLVAFHAALRPASSFFWLHDYSALCEGFNLLRNDVAYCHAPPPDSTACRVCVYGARRAAWLAALARLFRAIGFHVLAPGRVALDMFLARTALPFLSARVQENAVLAPAGEQPPPTADGPAAPGPAAEGPVRIGFLGYAMPQKGWAAFQRLVRQNAGRSAYRFMHFAIPAAHTAMPGLETIAVQVTPEDRTAAVRALAAARVDLVAVLSPWPETFSFVAHEAFAAGADVVALADSGNVADAVRRHRRGVVLADEAALARFFAAGWAIDYARQRALQPAAASRLLPSGATAGIGDIAAPLSPVQAAA